MMKHSNSCLSLLFNSHTATNLLILLLSFPSIESNNLIFIGDANNISGVAAMNRTGKALYGTTTKLSDFSSHFSFNMSSDVNRSSHGDGGICFLMVPHESNRYSKSYGGLLDMSGSNTSVLNPRSSETQVVVVDFDKNPSFGRIGVDVNSRKYKNGTTGGLLNKGTANAWITYNSKTQNLSASLAFTRSLGLYNVSYKVHLSFVLPTSVRVGFTASTGDGHVEIHQVFSWSFKETSISNYPDLSVYNRRFKLGLVIIVFVILFVLSILLIGLGLFFRFIMFRRRSSNNVNVEVDEESRSNIAPTDVDGESIEMEAGPKRFSYSELCDATSNFAEEFKIGEGGFGPVYLGSVTRSAAANQTVSVAIKKMKSGSAQGKKEFVAEIKIISNLRHKNLVKLIGWCCEDSEQLLVYELMPNSSLDKHLFRHDNVLLSWETRYRIVYGLASGLQYLHNGWEKCVVHRDIKSSNVMLDSQFNPRLGDFGLARFMDHGKSMDFTNPAGTIGYMAPELMSLKPSKESDVYSFGIVVLEIVTGRKPTFEAEESRDQVIVLAQWVRELEATSRILDAVDQRLESEFQIDQARLLLEVGLKCCQTEASRRPSISRVIALLQSDEDDHDSSSTCVLSASPEESSSSGYCTPSESFRESGTVNSVVKMMDPNCPTSTIMKLQA